MEKNMTVESNAKRFVDSIERRRNPHIRDYGSAAERGGHLEDYYISQEKKDLENYRTFMNSSAYDDVRMAESEITSEDLKNPTLVLLRKIGAYHDDV